MEENREENRELADEAVLKRSIKEPQLFAVLVERYQEPFLRKSRHILGDQYAAEDIVQETFTKIYLNAHRFQKQEGASFNSWAYKILLNTTFSQYKKLKKKGAETVKLDDEIWTLLPDNEADLRGSWEISDLISRVLTKLPESLARILTLHFIDDLPQKEIAEIEGISVAAVKTRIHRAKKEFKKLSPDFLQ